MAAQDRIFRTRHYYVFDTMSLILHGYLGKGIRIQHSGCVEDGVLELWRDSEDNITKYRSS